MSTTQSVPASFISNKYCSPTLQLTQESSPFILGMNNDDISSNLQQHLDIQDTEIQLSNPNDTCR